MSWRRVLGAKVGNLIHKKEGAKSAKMGLECQMGCQMGCQNREAKTQKIGAYC